MTEEPLQKFARASYLIAGSYGLVCLLLWFYADPHFPGIQLAFAGSSPPNPKLEGLIFGIAILPLFRAYAYLIKQKGSSIQKQAGPLGIFLLFHMLMSLYLAPYVSCLLDPNPPVTYRLPVLDKQITQRRGGFGRVLHEATVPSWFSPGDLVIPELAPADWLTIVPGHSVLYVTSGLRVLDHRWFRSETEEVFKRHPKKEVKDLVPPTPMTPVYPSFETFTSIRQGMSLDDIYRIAGHPDDNLDFGGLRLLTYRLDDGSEIDIAVDIRNRDLGMTHITKAGAKDELLRLSKANRVEIR